jgi:hypothetical protein
MSEDSEINQILRLVASGKFTIETSEITLDQHDIDGLKAIGFRVVLAGTTYTISFI